MLSEPRCDAIDKDQAMVVSDGQRSAGVVAAVAPELRANSRRGSSLSAEEEPSWGSSALPSPSLGPPSAAKRRWQQAMVGAAVCVLAYGPKEVDVASRHTRDGKRLRALHDTCHLAVRRHTVESVLQVVGVVFYRVDAVHLRGTPQRLSRRLSRRHVLRSCTWISCAHQATGLVEDIQPKQCIGDVDVRAVARVAA